ncbi:MucB/RseB C-terminal domain-containing protein [Aestuariibacter sp. AA17]|uniref:MucB/RseB C-terminal domain-containing protein n=1 Tax=Fluctibacter corallii TaxID=2984329 RepID=A0ABT3A3I7_9ALTE|nr:MucB/RseB C-terminal domain-containing protein [Aestuariibacter sp. AA17]MCV2883248.1 MucB/RseB C-terminal domain-containing protein [Aestuariibacter sp. AA17]
MIFAFLSTQAFAQGLDVQSGDVSNAKPTSQLSARAWLTKMSEAVRELNYHISFVVLKPGSEAQPYIWRHGISETGVEMEHLSMLNGPGQEVLRMGDQVSYFEPNVPAYSMRSDVINGPLPETLLSAPETLLGAYDFVLVGRNRISGRSAQQIRVVSTDGSRFGYVLWLDESTGLPLKLNMVDLKGHLLEQIQVTALQVTATPHEHFSRIETSKLPQVIEFNPNKSLEATWNLAFMPIGMEIVKRDRHRLPYTGQWVDYVMLSDGLVNVSVYLHEKNGAVADQDLLLRSESNTFLTRNHGSISVTVIGKVPAQTANAIASSITVANQ